MLLLQATRRRKSGSLLICFCHFAPYRFAILLILKINLPRNKPFGGHGLAARFTSAPVRSMSAAFTYLISGHRVIAST
jgi:hypothetical protein